MERNVGQADIGPWSKGRDILSKILGFREAGVLIPLVVLCVAVGLYNPVFFSYYNFISISRAISLTAIVALGMTFVLIAREIDLSVGSMLGLSGVMAGFVLVRGAPVSAGILVGMMTGVVLGFLNGFLTIRLRIPSLIVTLGTLYAARGAVYVITMGSPIYPMPKELTTVGTGKIAGIPGTVYVLAVMAILAHFFLTRTTYGRSVLAVGGNAEAARVTGIDVNRIRLGVFILSGLCSGIAGVLMLARLNSAEPGAGEAWELTVIASTIIGGTSMFGGYGTIPGTLIGTAITGVLVNILVLVGISAYWEKIVVGSIIVIAVSFDQYRREQVLRMAVAASRRIVNMYHNDSDTNSEERG